MIFKYELRFVAFTWPNLCSWVDRNFVTGIKNLKKKLLKPKENLKTYFFGLKKPRFLPALLWSDLPDF